MGRRRALHRGPGPHNELVFVTDARFSGLDPALRGRAGGSASHRDWQGPASRRSGFQWKSRPKNPATAPITLSDDGLGDALGSGCATGGGAAAVAGTGAEGAEAMSPACSVQIPVGAVPIRNGKAIARGQ